MISRRYFHTYRQPEVHFTVAGKLYKALLEAFWEGGLRLRIPDAPSLEPHQRITRLHFSTGRRQAQGPDLEIAHIRSQPPPSRIDARVCRPADARQLHDGLLQLSDDVERFVDASMDPTKIPRFSRNNHYRPSAVAARIRWTEAVSGTRLEHITHNHLNARAVAGNIENYIGTVQIPIGIAGPVWVRGVYTDGHIPLPIATTEGALVSSITRGAQTCNAAGGIRVSVGRQTMVRAPVFFCSHMDGAINLEHWIHDHLSEVRATAESYSSVARLEQIRTHVFDHTLHVQFYYHTGDASGQNMTTACTFMACRWIKRQVRNNPNIGLDHFMIEGNLSGDKKPNFQNFTLGRGVAVSATCRIPGSLLNARLRISPEQFVQHYQAGEVGALQAGMLGSNINFANVIAGVFAATGQDIACVGESALGYLKVRQEHDALIVSIYLPSLVIGTVGGGTKLPTQAECLALMGCAGSGKVFRLAEIIGAACLALDISTGAAVMTNEFVHAHEHFGRNRPNQDLSWSQIDARFFGDLLHDDNWVVESVVRGDLDTRNAIISDVYQSNIQGPCGLFRYHLRLRGQAGVQEMDAVLKIKPTGRQLVTIGVQVARLTGEDTLGGLFESQHHIFDLDNANVREIGLYQHAHPRLACYIPKIYGTRCDGQRKIYAILMEDLTGYSHLNSGLDPTQWEPAHIRSALTALVDLHSVYWNGRNPLPEGVPIEGIDPSRYHSSETLLSELTSFNAGRYPHLVSNEVKHVLEHVLQDLSGFVKQLQQHPMTLTHNDFNPRNLCFRSLHGSLKLVVYDWELALYQNPQHDLVEFLIFTLDSNAPLSLFDRYTHEYYQLLGDRLEDAPSPEQFEHGLFLNAVDLALIRFNLYLMGHNILHFNFLERVYGNLSRYLLRGWQQYK